jgi:hypothetical protein
MLAVFFSGILVGAIGHQLYAVRTVTAERPHDFRRKYVEDMKTRLQLSESQVSQLHQILDTTKEKFRSMKERQRPEAEQIKQDQRANIRSMLNASQRPEYEKMLEERDRKHRQHGERKP